MNFTQPCFIRKSPKYLTERVYRLGGRSGDGFWSSNIRALQDDNDFNQWFISENSEWWKNGHHDRPLNKSSLLGYRKATTKELIEHFK